MKAYVLNSIVIAIGENDSLFPNCTPIEITEEEKHFIESLIIPKRINGQFIEGATSEHINEINLEQTKETVRQFLNKKKQDGRNYFNEIELNITMQLVGMLLTDLVPVSKEIETILYRPLTHIKNGDYFSALMLFNDPETIAPTHPIVLNYWNNMKAYCIAYYNENYPTETIE